MADKRCEDCGHYTGCYAECMFDLDFDTPSVYVCRCLEKESPVTAFVWPFVLTSAEIAAWIQVSPRMREHLATLIKEREPFIAQIDQRKTYKEGRQENDVD